MAREGVDTPSRLSWHVFARERWPCDARPHINRIRMPLSPGSALSRAEQQPEALIPEPSVQFRMRIQKQRSLLRLSSILAEFLVATCRLAGERKVYQRKLPYRCGQISLRNPISASRVVYSKRCRREGTARAHVPITGPASAALRGPRPASVPPREWPPLPWRRSPPACPCPGRQAARPGPRR